MNKRIRELAEQTFSFKYKTAPDELNPGYTINELEKFAELIVRDCGNYMNRRIPGNLEVSSTVAKMKQHFGVGE